MSTEVILTSLPEQTNPVGTDITYIVDTANNLSKFASLANLPVSTATQTALDSKEPTITAGTTSQYYRGDKSFQTLDKTAVGLSNVDNTSDANKPVSTATQTALDGKIAKSTGTTYNVYTLSAVTQAEYDAIVTKDADTVYFII